MPLLVSGPLSSELARSSGGGDEGFPGSMEAWECFPWSSLDDGIAAANSDDRTVVSLGGLDAALRSLTCAMQSEDPALRAFARRVTQSPLVCSGHVDLLDALGDDVTSARLAGFPVNLVVVAGVWGSSLRGSVRDDQRRRMKQFAASYQVSVVRMKGKRGHRPIDLRAEVDSTQYESSEDLMQREQVHHDRDTDTWTLRCEIPDAHRHVLACGQSADNAAFALSGSVVFRALPSVLARCTAQSATVDASGITMVFTPRADYWPTNE